MISPPHPVVVLFASICLSVAASAQAHARIVFTGEPTLIVVNGYSTSQDWPRLLQRKLDRYYGGDRVVEVKSAVIASTPIAKLVDLKTGRPKKTWSVVSEALAGKGDRPAIAIGQQSLQWSYGAQKTGIRNPGDRSRIQSGARNFKKYVDLLRRSGADHVFVSTHVFKKQMEPVIRNEHYALEAYTRMGAPPFFTQGPNVWRPTRASYPEAYVADRIHLSELGAEIVAQEWFAFLLKNDGLMVPDWSVRELDAVKSQYRTAKAHDADNPSPRAKRNKKRIEHRTVER